MLVLVLALALALWLRLVVLVVLLLRLFLFFFLTRATFFLLCSSSAAATAAAAACFLFFSSTRSCLSSSLAVHSVASHQVARLNPRAEGGRVARCGVLVAALTLPLHCPSTALTLPPRPHRLDFTASPVAVGETIILMTPPVYTH